jgi:uncharacterized protein YhbP (UPF0306 family)
MLPAELLSFLRSQSWAVESSVSESGGPQAAVIGIAVSDQFELIFDTLASSRKHANLLRNPRAAFVIGWDHSRTVQYEGLAEQPSGAALQAAQAVYFGRFPDGPTRMSWPGISYWRVHPLWIRYSDYNPATPIILEWSQAQIRGWTPGH